MAGDRTGVLIIRAWVEEGSSEPVRAHILMTDDVSLGYEREVTLSRTEAVSAQVEEWLSQFFSGVERPREDLGDDRGDSSSLPADVPGTPPSRHLKGLP